MIIYTDQPKSAIITRNPGITVSVSAGPPGPPGPPGTLNVVELSEADYLELAYKEPNTIYVIT